MPAIESNVAGLRLIAADRMAKGGELVGGLDVADRWNLCFTQHMRKWCILFLWFFGALVSAEKPIVLFVIGEAEYGTRETLPEFAENELKEYDCQFIFAKSDDRESPDVHVFPGLKDALGKADLLFLSVRRRYPVAEDMKAIRRWFRDGKPTVAIRTSSHPFGERGKAPYLAPDGHAAWNTFDEDVLGASYTGHYKAKDGHATINTEAIGHPILEGVKDGFKVSSHLYKSKLLDPATTELMSGSVGDARESVAWTREKDGQRIFYTSLGGVEDMAIPAVRTMLVNAVTWALTELPGLNLVPQDDLEVEVLLQDPLIAQPAFLNFDERGRMWVVQYRQYPEPGGVHPVSKDKYWRAVYDRVPAPPGHPDFVPGQDRITIHEDTNGDGSFDHTKVFLDGLNLATSCVRGHRGVYVLQPPYLLFYLDENEDDVPDGDPEVLLEGFGIEDTHSICNSLCWGPDGWLYASQGSTVTAAVRIPGSRADPVRSVGQLIWRYHPQKRKYEIFAEGGGNIWSCEFDEAGRLFAGSNGGSPGFFYLQGAYYQKNFSKHGDLSNPYAYGFFKGISHPGFKRVSTNLLIYEGGALPERYEGALIACNPVLREFRASALEKDGLGFKSRYIDELVRPKDHLFRPVYADFGPDGALYVCDWVDTQVNHYRNHEGHIRKRDGKIIRIRTKGASSIPPFDLRKKSLFELADLLTHENRWWRETARRLIAEREDRIGLTPRLMLTIRNKRGLEALEALWVMHTLGNLHHLDYWRSILEHDDPLIRQWMIRLIGDDPLLGGQTYWSYHSHVGGREEQSLEVWGQLASNLIVHADPKFAAKVLPEMIQFNEQLQDPRLGQMIWWAFERVAEQVGAGGRWIVPEGEEMNSHVSEVIASRQIRKLLDRGSIEDFSHAVWWARNSGSKGQDAVLEATRDGFARDMPLELVSMLVEANPDDLALQIRSGFNTSAVREGLAVLKEKALSEQRLLDLLHAFRGQVSDQLAEILIGYLHHPALACRVAALQVLETYRGDRVDVASPLVEAYRSSSPGQEQDVLRTVLASKPDWARKLVAGVENPESLPADTVVVLRSHGDEEIDRALLGERESSEKIDLNGWKSLYEQPDGDPYAGRLLYVQRCGSCHYLHNEGGHIGPDLTPYQRSEAEDVLLAILDPSAEIREGFELVTVRLKDGRILSGCLVEDAAKTIVLRQPGGQTAILDRREIKRVEWPGVSLMPAGLLDGLQESEIRDLFSYLRTSQPLNVKNK